MWKILTSSAFERLVTFLGAMVWTTWEIMIRDQARIDVLAFIATLLAAKEGVRAVIASREPDSSTGQPS